MYFPIPEDERLQIDQSRPDRLIITGINVRLTPEQAISGKALVVRATTVEIDGRLHLPSGRMEIFARRIIAHKGAVLDVSGAAGSPDYAGRAAALSGTSPGAPGRAGENGGDGGPGGKIAIIAETLEGELKLLANGGIGGGAQSGGNGIKGARGRNHIRCTPPERGGTGGAAGSAGIPGKGGDAGEIKIAVLTPLASGQIDAQVNAGSPGAPGKHGSPGDGGEGGKGGEVGHMVSEPCVI